MNKMNMHVYGHLSRKDFETDEEYQQAVEDYNDVLDGLMEDWIYESNLKTRQGDNR